LHGQPSGLGGVFRNDKQSKRPTAGFVQWDLKILVKELEPECHAAQHILSVMNPRNGTILAAFLVRNLPDAFPRVSTA
jgi:hypothetical protein